VNVIELTDFFFNFLISFLSTALEWTQQRINCRQNQHSIPMIQRITELYEYLINNKTGNMLWRNSEVRSCAHCCGGKAIRITQRWVCICSRRYPAYHEHEPYCHLWPAPFYRMFPHYLTNAGFSKKKLLNIKVVSIFTTTFVWNIFNSKKNYERYNRKCILLFMKIIPYSCPVLMKLEFSRQIFEKCLINTFRDNHSNGRGVVPCGQTVERTERYKANSHFSQFCESV